MKYEIQEPAEAGEVDSSSDSLEDRVLDAKAPSSSQQVGWGRRAVRWGKRNFSARYGAYQGLAWVVSHTLPFVMLSDDRFNNGNLADAFILTGLSVAALSVAQVAIYVAGETLTHGVSPVKALKQGATLRGIELILTAPVSVPASALQLHSLSGHIGSYAAVTGSWFGLQTIWNFAVGMGVNSLYRHGVALPKELGSTLDIGDAPYFLKLGFRNLHSVTRGAVAASKRYAIALASYASAGM